MTPSAPRESRHPPRPGAPQGARATEDGPTPVDPLVTPAGRTLATVLRLELEDVLQSIFAARQDVLALADTRDPEGTRRSAERTLQGCAATVQLLLRLVRVGPENDPSAVAFAEMMGGPFGVLGADYEVLYFNTALRDLIGLEYRTIALSRFRDRRWIDRGVMAAHLDLATAEGCASMRTVLARNDAVEVPVRVRTARIDDHPEPLLLISLVPVAALPGPGPS